MTRGEPRFSCCRRAGASAGNPKSQIPKPSTGPGSGALCFAVLACALTGSFAPRASMPGKRERPGMVSTRVRRPCAARPCIGPGAPPVTGPRSKATSDLHSPVRASSASGTSCRSLTCSTRSAAPCPLTHPERSRGRRSPMLWPTSFRRISFRPAGWSSTPATQRSGRSCWRRRPLAPRQRPRPPPLRRTCPFPPSAL